jgi:hypothetical protein
MCFSLGLGFGTLLLKKFAFETVELGTVAEQ